MKTESLTNQLSVGRHPLHLAAAIGNTDVVITLLERGADPDCQDENGDTPLHIATQYGHSNVVVCLVACSADFEIKNKTGHTALFTAIMDKNIHMVEMLLGFGVDPCVTEWQWPEKHYGPTEIKILEAFDRHCQLIPGLKHEFVKKDLLFARPNKHCHSDSLQLRIKTDNIPNPYVLQCYKLQKEYCNTKFVLGKSVHCLTDVYDIRTWMSTCRDLQLTIAVNQCSNKNMTFLGVENCTGQVNIIQGGDEMTESQETRLAIKLSMKNHKLNRCKFTVCYNEATERISFLETGTTMKINGFKLINPAYSVPHDVNINLQVLPAEDFTHERGYNEFTDERGHNLSTDESGHNVFTNERGHNVFASNIYSFSRTVQFSEEVELTIPVTNCPDETISLVTGELNQCNVENLRLINDGFHPNADKITIKTTTLPILCAVVRNGGMEQSSLTKLKTMLQASLEHKRRVLFMVFTKQQLETDDHTLVIQCALFNKKECIEERWTQKGHKKVGESESHECFINSVFKVGLSGNIEDLFHCNQMDLEFHLYRDNYRVFNVTIPNVNAKAEGVLKIQQVIPKRTDIVQSKILGCTVCGGGRPKTACLDQLNTIYSCTISFERKENSEKHTTPLRQVLNGFRLMRLNRINKIRPM